MRKFEKNKCIHLQVHKIVYFHAKFKENRKFSYYSLAISKNNILNIYLLGQPTTPQKIYFKTQLELNKL